MTTARVRVMLAALSVLLALGVVGECPMYTYKLRGRVLSAGRPVANAVVSCTQDGQQAGAAVRTSVDGSFEVSVTEGTHDGTSCRGGDRCRPPRGPSIGVAVRGIEGSTTRTIQLQSDPAAFELVVEIGVFELEQIATPVPIQKAEPARDVPIPVGGEVKAPVLLRRVEPALPDREKHAVRIQPFMLFELVVDRSGNVTYVRTLKANDETLLQYVVPAIRQWKFRPATLHGKPVTVLYNIYFRYEVR